MWYSFPVDHSSDLNPAQREAVETTEGPLLIIAGAGAGKTKTLTYRILHLVTEKKVEPRNILAVTFTNKAAGEMRSRVEGLLRKTEQKFASLPFVSTFHALGVHILRENAELLGLPKHFGIFDQSSSKRAIKEAMEKTEVSSLQFEPGRLQGIISKEKGKNVSAEEYAAKAGNEYVQKIVAGIWKEYERILAREKSLDFDDLLVMTARLLEKNAAVREHYQNLWHYVHIDEYQDTNRVQYKISNLIAGERKNICAVGDIDQNIYTWRGANIQNIIRFEKDYPGAKIILLEENYRSTQNILTAANQVIGKNKIRRDKNLFTKAGEGEKISLYSAYDENDEAHFVAGEAGRLIKRGISAEEIAVLYRANFQSRALEEAFLAQDIPYQMLGTKFFERKEVKDVLSYIRASLNPESLSDVARIINSPARGIGKITLAKIFEGKESLLPEKMKEKMERFREVLQEIKEYSSVETPSALIKFVMKRSGIEDELGKDKIEGEERLENLRELVTLASKYDALPKGEGIMKLLDEASLVSDQDSLGEKKGVKLMTVHASKGLEFEYVFIVGLEQDLFPHKRLSEENVTEEEAEEERRIFYVAVTRAKKKLYLTSCSLRTIFGSKQVNLPSEFLGDIDDSLMESANPEEPKGRIRTIYLD